ARLLGRLGLFPHPLPVALWASLASRCPRRPGRPSGEATGLPRSVVATGWVRSRRFAGGAPSAPADRETAGLDPVPGWAKRVSIFRLLVRTTLSSASPGLPIPPHPGARPQRCSESQAGLASCAAIRKEEATLPRELRPPPLPARHVPVGY